MGGKDACTRWFLSFLPFSQHVRGGVRELYCGCPRRGLSLFLTSAPIWSFLIHGEYRSLKTMGGGFLLLGWLESSWFRME